MSSSSPITSRRSRRRSTSSSASLSAVSRREASPGSTLPPGKETCPAWSRSPSVLSVYTIRAPSGVCRIGTRTAALRASSAGTRGLSSIVSRSRGLNPSYTSRQLGRGALNAPRSRSPSGSYPPASNTPPIIDQGTRTVDRSAQQERRGQRVPERINFRETLSICMTTSIFLVPIDIISSQVGKSLEHEGSSWRRGVGRENW